MGLVNVQLQFVALTRWVTWGDEEGDRTPRMRAGFCIGRRVEDDERQDTQSQVES